jgi:hypothetical protein
MEETEGTEFHTETRRHGAACRPQPKRNAPTGIFQDDVCTTTASPEEDPWSVSWLAILAES